MSIEEVYTLKNHLEQCFPDGVQPIQFDLGKLLKGLDEHMEREIEDGRIPQKWTDTELQWDSVCNGLFEHYTMSQGEQLAWLLLWLASDRCHGLWRIPGNGTRRPSLEKLKGWRNWSFALRARLGVVDGWIRRNQTQPYSKALFEGFANPLLMCMSPRTQLWNGAKSQVSLYERVVGLYDLPVSAEWLGELDQMLNCAWLSDEGVTALQSLPKILADLPKKQRNAWGNTEPLAVQALLSPIQKDAMNAMEFNSFWMAKQDS